MTVGVELLARCGCGCLWMVLAERKERVDGGDEEDEIDPLLLYGYGISRNGYEYP